MSLSIPGELSRPTATLPIHVPESLLSDSVGSALRAGQSEDAQLSPKKGRHKRNLVSFNPDMPFSALLQAQVLEECTYNALSRYLTEPDEHIVFEYGGPLPHVVVSRPDYNPWDSFVQWFNAVQVVEPCLFPPPVYIGPGHLPCHLREESSDDDNAGLPSPDSLASSTDLSSESDSDEWIDPAAPLLQAAKYLRGAHIHDSPDPSRSPHIIIVEAPPSDPQVLVCNSVQEQDLQFGRRLAVPYSNFYNEPEDGETDYEQIVFDMPSMDIVPPEYCSIPHDALEEVMNADDYEEHYFETYDGDVDEEPLPGTRPDSPLPQTPPDETLSSLFDQYMPLHNQHQEPNGSQAALIPAQPLSPLWKANLEDTLQDEYRLDDDDEELPELDW